MRNYQNTEYVESEIPTAAKLNQMDGRVQDTAELHSSAFVDICGDDRVIDNAAVDTELETTASSPADMNVHVNVGRALVSGNLVANEASKTLTIVEPQTSNRYTIIQISNLGAITTKNGTEAGSPSEPAVDANNIKLAAIYLPQLTTKIEDAVGSYGYIIDRRDFSGNSLATKKKLPIQIQGQVSTSGGPNDDGYYFGASGAGYTFDEAVTITKVAIQAQDVPTGADLILTFHNVTDTTSDTATLSAGSAFYQDPSIDLDLDASDEMSMQVTQVGSTNPGGDLNIIIHYQMQP